MRPTIGGDAAPSRSRKSSIVDSHPPATASATPTTFFLAKEEDVMGSTAVLPALPSSSRRASSTKPVDSVYGVQSLEEALGGAFPDKSGAGEEENTGGIAGLLKRKRRKASQSDTVDKHVVECTEDSTRHSSPQDNGAQHHIGRSSRAATVSQPLTPLQLGSPFPHSTMPGTPKSGSFRSLRLSDEEESVTDGGSQAIVSSGEEDDDESEGSRRLEMSGNAPELVMPSLSMPSRRPFTARGKQMGRLKVCVAGSDGESCFRAAKVDTY